MYIQNVKGRITMIDNRCGSRPAAPSKPIVKKPPLDSRTYVKQAENVIQELDKNKNDSPDLSTSQLRNIHTMITELYNMVSHYDGETLSDEILSHIQYTKMKIAYNAGRDKKVKDFVLRAQLMDYLDSADNKSALLLVCHYSEALVAYHRFYRKEND